jgi:alkaline phosphatase
MGISTTTAARIFEGQSRGKTGEETVLSWEKFPYTALSKTYNTNAQIADSAGTATAFASGVKTDKGEEFLRGRFICISDTKPC